MLFEVMFEFKLKFYFPFYFILFILPFNACDTQQESEVAEVLYKKLFIQQRAEQLHAIKNFKRVSNYEKQYSMITLMAEKVFETIMESRVFIEASPYIPGISDFPLDTGIRDALSNILENTALFSEIVLRFPEICTGLLKRNNNWDLVLQWGIAFSYQMKYLLDDSTVKLLNLVSQELNHIDRDPNYINPYRIDEPRREEIVEIKPPKKKKKPVKKGPKLSSHFEL